MFQAAFIFIGTGIDSAETRARFEMSDVTLQVVGTKDYADAEKVAKTLVSGGVGLIELCAGFGTEGVARIKQAAGPGVVVGAVRFDHHPGLGDRSGDELFS